MFVLLVGVRIIRFFLGVKFKLGDKIQDILVVYKLFMVVLES